jgi:hypothetical protein
MKLVVEPGGRRAAALLAGRCLPLRAGASGRPLGRNVDAARFGELVSGLPA